MPVDALLRPLASGFMLEQKPPLTYRNVPDSARDPAFPINLLSILVVRYAQPTHLLSENSILLADRSASSCGSVTATFTSEHNPVYR